MKEKRKYWQGVRGTCILAVVLIHSLGGFDYSTGYNMEFVILRQIINFAVATFVFMAGYFVNTDAMSDKEFSYKHWIICRGGRLCIPFIIWSLLYSGLELLKTVHSGGEIHWRGFVCRFIVGKSATPFYYIVVLVQLTVITPWLVKIVKRNGIISRILWLVTPFYLVCLYIWNYIVGTSPRLYETLFPAWFGFYYLGIQVHCEKKVNSNGYVVAGTLLLSCIEAIGLRAAGFDIGFYISQITVGSFLYSVAMIGWLLKKSENNHGDYNLLTKIGDCSYGIFYIHMAVLMIVSRFIKCENWYAYWILRFVLTAAISYIMVYIGQIVLKKHKKLLRYSVFHFQYWRYTSPKHYFSVPVALVSFSSLFGQPLYASPERLHPHSASSSPQ